MISMSQVHSIRQLRKEGDSIAEIARKVGVSRTTVYAKLAEQDLSPKMPVRHPKDKLLDPYRPIIESWLDEDSRNWHKQRHTAHRIWQRLRDEYSVECAESTVRQYVRELKGQRKSPGDVYLDLAWSPGIAQADFGEADFYVHGTKRRLSFFVLSFPYSNMGYAQVFPSENSECVCQALKQIFEYLGAVPTRIVFDNATGVGRRICDVTRMTEIFGAFAAHYGFDVRFCNPRAGNEKGNVEGKVKYIRKNAFVPLPRIQSVAAYNKRLLGKCDALSKEHYLKGEDEYHLFVEDKFAMMGLPEKAFNVVRYVSCKSDKQGKVQVDGRHFYSTDPAYAKKTLIVELGATELSVFTDEGEFICEHERQYGSAPTDSTNPASQLPLLVLKLGAWHESKVRCSLPDDLRAYLDDLEKRELGGALRMMLRQTEEHGWDAAVDAMELALESTGRLDEASVTVAANASACGSITYDEKVDLGVYDSALGLGA